MTGTVVNSLVNPVDAFNVSHLAIEINIHYLKLNRKNETNLAELGNPGDKTCELINSIPSSPRLTISFQILILETKK